jgi:hypothetical protein
MNKYQLTLTAAIIALAGFAGGLHYSGRQVHTVARNAFAAGAMTGIELQKLNAGLKKQGVGFTQKEWNDLIEREFTKKVNLQ